MLTYQCPRWPLILSVGSHQREDDGEILRRDSITCCAHGTSRRDSDRRMSGGKRGSRRPYQRCCARRATYLNNKEVPAIRAAWAVSGMRVLEWVAVEHDSTERPQAHVVVCGFGASGGSFGSVSASDSLNWRKWSDTAPSCQNRGLSLGQPLDNIQRPRSARRASSLR